MSLSSPPHTQLGISEQAIAEKIKGRKNPTLYFF